MNRTRCTSHHRGTPRRAAPLIVLLTAAVLSPAAAPAQQPDESAARSVYAQDEVDRALERAIGYLMQQQHEEEGWINDKKNKNQTAITALAVMAMAAVGHEPTDPSDPGRAMRAGLAFVLRDDRQDDNGYYGKADGSRMYGHGIITLMLAEMLGHGADAEQDRRIRQRCRAAIDLILRAQETEKGDRHRGGWRYKPDSNDSDLSVTVWQLMALRSAKNAGLSVPGSAIRKAVEYLERSYYEEGNRAGRFAYQVGSRAGFATTAAGLLAMQVSGEYDAPEVEGAADWLMENPPEWNESWLLYGTYYYAQGMYQRSGDRAREARRRVRDLLMDRQHDNGSWRSSHGTERGAGRVYCTSMAMLSLSVKYHYLPIYQR